jgi:tyrosyl-tRNA synthetase
MAGEHGISFTEFSYMLLQANDYSWLHRHEGCELQVGGSDQWGNILSGVDLVRRAPGLAVHGALCWPLITRADGTKFGKSAGARLARPGRTSPYAFSSTWCRSMTPMWSGCWLQFTLLPGGRGRRRGCGPRKPPTSARAQRVLARALTALVHGDEAAAAAEQAAGLLFGTSQDTLTEGALATLCDEIPTTRLDPVGRDLLEVLEATDLVRSRSDARRALDAGELWCNHRRLGSPDPLEVGDLWFGRYVLLRRGRKRHHLVVRGLAEPVA